MKPEDLKRRIGKFRIYWKELDLETPANLLRIFSNFVIVRAESLYHVNAVEYVAYSPLFDRIGEGEDVPEYELGYLSADDLIYLVSVRKKTK